MDRVIGGVETVFTQRGDKAAVFVRDGIRGAVVGIERGS